MIRKFLSILLFQFIFSQSLENSNTSPMHILGTINKLDNIIKNSICGICNLNIATGLQNKILTYISYGLPCISSELSYKNTFLVRNREILVYKNDDGEYKIQTCAVSKEFWDKLESVDPSSSYKFENITKLKQLKQLKQN